MPVASPEELAAAAPDQVVPIGDRLWWVGRYIEGDPFQCHAYLLEHGDQSVLIDPGSTLTIDETLRKIEQIIPFSDIRYFLCHHQDPDIAGALPELCKKITRDDACVVSHWRAKALLKHYDLPIPFWLVEDHDWVLDLGGRELEFVFTPYLHFPGAFCSFDRRTGILFSSDLFGGYTDKWSLVAKDESHFEALRPFHEHYMPSREVLVHGLSQLEKLPIVMIAPQHGALIPEHLVSYMFERLKGLECGLYVMARGNTDVHHLSRMNRALRDVLNSMILYREFKEVAGALLSLVQDLLPVRSLEFFSSWQDSSDVLHLSPQTRYRGEIVAPPEFCRELMGLDRDAVFLRHHARFFQRDLGATDNPEPALLLPLIDPDTQQVNALAVARLKKPIVIAEETEQLLAGITMPLEVALERERIYRSLELERQDIYERSIRDPLTGLYTRVYMQETLQRFMAMHDRDASALVGLVMFDVDHFKRINDTLGHMAGDKALQRVAQVLRDQIRGTDLAVRLGGEEFALFLAGRSAAHAGVIAERTRASVEALEFEGVLAGRKITVSAGVALRHQNENLDSLISRADVVLYEAKRAGRNRVVTDDS